MVAQMLDFSEEDQLKYPQLNKQIVVMPRAFKKTALKILELGVSASPRGLNTIEMINATLMVRDPVDRVITDAGRKINFAFALAEWIAFMKGIDDINFFTTFIKDYTQYSSDGQHLDGAYGPRVHNVLEGTNQINDVINKLKSDMTTRQAVMTIYDSEDLTSGRGGINIPCTLSIQFLVRDNLLYTITNMRSSDLIKGFTYDMFVFTMLQEYIARQLDLGLGAYIHNSGSLHLYEQDYEAGGIIDRMTETRWPYKMPDMPISFSSIHLDSLRDFAMMCMSNDQVTIDKHFKTAHVLRSKDDEAFNYVLDLAHAMRAFVDRVADPESAQLAYSSIKSQTIKHITLPWLKQN